MANIIPMTMCGDVEASLAAYVDGAASATDRGDVERHLRRCPACQQRVLAERAVREAIVRHRGVLTGGGVPAALQARLTGLAEGARTPATAAWRGRLARLAASAAVVLASGGWMLGVATRDSMVVLAAQLTADHAKCFFTAHDRGLLDPERTTEMLRHRYGLDVDVPPSDPGMGLRLVGARRCLSGEGTNAHLLYTWRGESVSLYVLPGDHRPPADVSMLGHDVSAWTGHNGTYVLVTHQPAHDLVRLVEFMRRATE